MVFGFFKKEKVEEVRVSNYKQKVTDLIKGINEINGKIDILGKNLAANYENTTMIQQINTLIPSLEKQIIDVKTLSQTKLETLSNMDVGKDSDLVDRKNFLVFFILELDKLKFKVSDFKTFINRGKGSISSKDLIQYEGTINLNRINLGKMPNL